MYNYIVKDIKPSSDSSTLESELNNLAKDGYKIILCEYIKHEYLDINKNPSIKTYYRIIGEKSGGKVLKG
jgi:hypothetical protein